MPQRIKSSKYDCSASLACWWAVPLTHLAPGNVTLGQMTTGKALTAPSSSSPRQGHSCRTMDSPVESRASFFCFLYQLSWRIRFKTWTSIRTFWTFSHLYRSSKSHQVPHLWFQGSATHWSTWGFFALTPSRKHMNKLNTSHCQAHQSIWQYPKWEHFTTTKKPFTEHRKCSAIAHDKQLAVVVWQAFLSY